MDETNPNTEYARTLQEATDADIAELLALPVNADTAIRRPIAGHRTITDHVDALGQRIYTQWDRNGWAVAAWPATEFGVRNGRLR